MSMSALNIFRLKCSPGLPLTFVQVRTAARKIRKSRVYTEITDMALWRKSRGLETNPNKFGPLTYLADYSYLDGRPVPLSLNLRKRLEVQRQYVEDIVRLSSEVDWAKEDYKRRCAEKTTNEQKIIKSKLHPKGRASLSSNENKV